MSQQKLCHPLTAALGLCLLLQGCTEQDQQRPDSAAAASRALQAALAFPANCSVNPQDALPLEAPDYAASHQIRRGRGSNPMKIVSLTPDSSAWLTDCPVKLELATSKPSETCDNYPVLPEGAELRILREPATGNLLMMLAGVENGDFSLILRTLAPRTVSSPSGDQVVWLESKPKSARAPDFYVYMLDVEIKPGERIQRYSVEVFAKGANNCDAHRPETTLIGFEDLKLAPDSEAEAGTLDLPPARAVQTDAGTGNEPPRR